MCQASPAPFTEPIERGLVAPHRPYKGNTSLPSPASETVAVSAQNKRLHEQCEPARRIPEDGCDLLLMFCARPPPSTTADSSDWGRQGEVQKLLKSLHICHITEKRNYCYSTIYKASLVVHVNSLIRLRRCRVTGRS